MNEKPWEIPFTKERLLNTPPGCCPYCYKSYSTTIHKEHIKAMRAREAVEEKQKVWLEMHTLPPGATPSIPT